jgi:hypothetical protein
MSSNADWSAATWEGSRRAQIRRNLRLTVRERLEALEDLTETSDRLARTAREAPTEMVAEAARNDIPDSAAPDG